MAGTNKLGLFPENPYLLDRRFLASWVLATFIGVLAGWKVFDQMNISGLEGSAASFILLSKWFISLGIVVSLAQWFALQQAIKVKWWLLTSTAGFIASGAIGALLRNGLIRLTGPILADLIVGAMIGSIAGVIQWLGLRRSFPHAGLWIVANGIGWSLGWASFRADFFRSAYLVPGMQVILPAMLLGVPLSIITGVALDWLIQRREDRK